MNHRYTPTRFELGLILYVLALLLIAAVCLHHVLVAQ